jgi:hypothetical protein
MIATVVFVLVHVPPGIASVSVVFEPVQTVVAPAIGTGTEFTVAMVVAAQPEEGV